jgi:lipopolysaccharide/colanic/teichoic acid biosynthesis glycosyltransferase
MKHVRVGDDFLAAEGVSAEPVGGVYEVAGKRAFDLLFGLAIAPFVLPLIGLLGLIVWLNDGAAPLFGHLRAGKGGRSFRCWKIRTMVPDAEARLREHLAADPEAAAEWARYRKLRRDPRITALGDFLRRTSLDELPQLWNVLRGEMSFVGPRPVMQDELDQYYGPSRRAYGAMRPGITGLWQVSGRNELSYEDRVALDVDYLKRLSFPLDLWIILRTVGVVVRPTGR